MSKTLERENVAISNTKKVITSNIKSDNYVNTFHCDRYLQDLTFNDDKYKESNGISSKGEDIADIIQRSHKKKKHTIEYLRYKREPVLKNILKYAEKFRDSCNKNNVIESAQFISMLKSFINNLWDYSPEVEPNFAKIIISLEDAISEGKWTVLNKGQINCIIDIINMCLAKEITAEDQKKAFQILYMNDLDPFPKICLDENDED